MEFKYNISEEEARKRVDGEYLIEVKLLDKDSKEYQALTDNEKKVIYHLCRAGFWIEKVDYQLNCKENLDFYHFCKAKADGGDEHSANVLRLLKAQKSINSLDNNGDQINLADGVDNKNNNFYHLDNLSISDFHNLLSEMLSNGQKDEVATILSCRSIVEYKDNKLIATDYVDYFKEEFTNCANELLQASKFADDIKFKEYLLAQAEALKTANNKLDAKADMLWAKLKETRLEFTITRECYNDPITNSIFANEELVAKLKENNIEINPKDNLGARVGIVNLEGTALLDKLATLNDIACNLMPYKEEYSSVSDNSNPNQVAVDVDLIAMTGDTGAYRAGIVLAENLPNSDKLAIKLGGGRRNVYHRQVRTTKSSELYKILLNPDYIKYYNLEACHWGTIEHENTHSLGPKKSSLGEFASIIEEFKADMGIYAFLEEYENAGLFTQDQVNQIIVTELYSNFSKAKPKMSQAHRVRSVMITNRMMSEKAITFSNNQLSFDIPKVIEVAKTMLAEVVRLQLDGSVKNAKDYVDKYFVWTDAHQTIAEIIKKHSKKLNGEVVAPIYEEAITDLSL